MEREDDDLSALKVLIVDDSEHSRILIEGLLDSIGIARSYSAEGGEEALALLAQEDTEIDLILCDIEMPDMGGFELVRRVRRGEVSDRKDLPILILTAHHTVANLQRYDYSLVSAFIPKTHMAEHLEAQIRRAMRGGVASPDQAEPVLEQPSLVSSIDNEPDND